MNMDATQIDNEILSYLDQVAADVGASDITNSEKNDEKKIIASKGKKLPKNRPRTYKIRRKTMEPLASIT